ncbi:hypothetical protein BH11ACT4_BH11ACT4_01680 [soil metagenome]
MEVPGRVLPYQHRRRPDSVLPWVLLVGQAFARAYLVFLLALVTFALSPMIFGMAATVVHGVSMRPLIVAGDVVLSLPYDQGSPVPLGRVVLFEAQAGSGRSGLVIHRIVAIQPGGMLVTKGDGDADADITPLARADIIAEGKVLIPWIGLPALWLAENDWLPLGVWVVGTILALLVDAKRSPASSHTPVPRGVPAAAALVAALVIGSVTISHAMFTARTTSVGNNWNYPAATPATQLAFTTNPPNSTGGIAFARQPVVTVEDAQGRRTTGVRIVTISLVTPGGATLSCAANPVSASGTVAFSGCAVDRPGTYQLRATSPSLLTATSTSFVISVGPAAKLQFSASPGDTMVGAAFATQPTVTVLDLGGNLVSSTAPVTLKVTGDGALACRTNPVAAVAGTARFAGCSIATAGGYSIDAMSGTLAPATSTGFVITPPPIPALSCQSLIWIATFSWSPTPYVPTTYTLYVNGVKVRATGADGWNSYVQLTSDNVPVSLFPAGVAIVEVRKVVASGQEVVVGRGTVRLGTADFRTYFCG